MHCSIQRIVATGFDYDTPWPQDRCQDTQCHANQLQSGFSDTSLLQRCYDKISLTFLLPVLRDMELITFTAHAHINILRGNILTTITIAITKKSTRQCPDDTTLTSYVTVVLLAVL